MGAIRHLVAFAAALEGMSKEHRQWTRIERETRLVTHEYLGPCHAHCFEATDSLAAIICLDRLVDMHVASN